MIDSILIGLILPHNNKLDIEDELSEMELLANTLGYKIIYKDYQNKSKIDPTTYFGKGKIANMKHKINLMNIKTIFMNNELKPNHYSWFGFFYG